MNVELATSNDLAGIWRWLEDEYNKAGKVGFWGNRRLIEKSLEVQELFVVKHNGDAVAFQMGLYLDGIICVREEFQKKGIGKELLDATIQRAFRNNVNVLRGECSPVSSLSYWKKHGFTQLTNEPRVEVQRILERQLDLSTGFPEVLVEIFVYPESVLRNKAVPHSFFQDMRGARTENGAVKLPRRVIVVKNNTSANSDSVLKLVIDGKELYFDKIKYQGAKTLGFFDDRIGGSFYLDEVLPVYS
jgi:GNAT superfamily N-acetyltransferase